MKGWDSNNKVIDIVFMTGLSTSMDIVSQTFDREDKYVESAKVSSSFSLHNNDEKRTWNSLPNGKRKRFNWGIFFALIYSSSFVLDFIMKTSVGKMWKLLNIYCEVLSIDFEQNENWKNRLS